MATQKPISTISYNSKAFLLEKLEELRAAHKIQYYYVIFHKGEDGDKDHAHVYVVPNCRLDPMTLSEYFKEYVPGSTKPLGCMAWRPSKEPDWILYAVHDADYLASKYGADKCEKLPYQWTDIIAPDDINVELYYLRAKGEVGKSSAGAYKAIRSGVSPTNLMLQGYNVNMLLSMMKLLEIDSGGGFYNDWKHNEAMLRALYKALADAGLEAGFNDDGEMVVVPSMSGEYVQMEIGDIEGIFDK